MNEISYLPSYVGKTDPERVVCDRCGDIGPIEERAEVSINILGESLGSQYLCRECFFSQPGIGALLMTPSEGGMGSACDGSEEGGVA